MNLVNLLQKRTSLLRFFTVLSLTKSSLLYPRRNGIKFPYQLSLHIGTNLTVSSPEVQYTFDEVFTNDEYKRLCNVVASIEHPIVLDLGANVGLASLRILLEATNVRVVAYEPLVSNYKLLVQNTTGFHDRFEAHCAAVSTWNGRTAFYDEGDHGCIDVNRFESEIVTEVQVVDFVDVMHSSKPNILKMDIESTELLILTDPRCLSELKGVVHITVEVHGNCLSQLLQNVNSVKTSLESVAFRCSAGRQIAECALILTAER